MVLKSLKYGILAALCFAPLGVALGLNTTPDRVEQYFPVYSEPSDVTFEDHDLGFALSFTATKKHTCVIPKEKTEQDIFVSLKWMDGNEVSSQPSDVFPADDPERPFRNILIVGVPAHIGPFSVTVPDKMVGKLLSMDLRVKCKRPYMPIGYATMGPFDLTDANQYLIKD